MFKYKNISTVFLSFHNVMLFFLSLGYSAAKSILIPEENIILPPGCLSYSDCGDTKQIQDKSGYSENSKNSETPNKNILEDKKISKELKKFYTRYLKNSIKCHIDAIMGINNDYCNSFVQKLKNKEKLSDSTENLASASPSINSSNTGTSTAFNVAVQGPQNGIFTNQNNVVNNHSSQGNFVPGIQLNPCIRSSCGGSNNIPLSINNSVLKAYDAGCIINTRQVQGECSSAYGMNKMSPVEIPALPDSLSYLRYNSNAVYPGQNQSCKSVNKNVNNSYNQQYTSGFDRYQNKNVGALVLPQNNYAVGLYNPYNNMVGMTQIPLSSAINKNFEMPNDFDYQGCINNFISCIEKIKKKKLGAT